MTFEPQTWNQWRTRITCPDVRDSINTQLMNNLAVNTETAMPLWHIDKRLFRSLLFDLRLLPLTITLFKLSHLNRFMFCQILFSPLFTVAERLRLWRQRRNNSEQLHFLEGAEESAEPCLPTIRKEGRLLSPSLCFPLSHSETFPFLVSSLRFAVNTHSCSLFASHLSCPCYYSLSLSLERGLDDFLFLSVVSFSVRSLPHHVTPPCLTSLTLSFHQYTHPCNLNISESISLSLTKNQFGLETLYFSWCNKKENLMGVDLSAASTQI